MTFNQVYWHLLVRVMIKEPEDKLKNNSVLETDYPFSLLDPQLWWQNQIASVVSLMHKKRTTSCPLPIMQPRLSVLPSQHVAPNFLFSLP